MVYAQEDASFCFYETGVTGVCLLVASCFRTYVPSGLTMIWVVSTAEEYKDRTLFIPLD